LATVAATNSIKNNIGAWESKIIKIITNKKQE